MNESEPVVEPIAPKPWYRKELVLFIATSLVIALALVLVSMALYASSGAAQLDLSRPGYKSVQSELDQSDNFEGFPATGAVNKDTLDKFQQLYDKQTKLVTDTDVFSPSVLDDSALGLDDVTASNQ